MGKFLDPTGQATWSVGICDRCRSKYYYDELSADGDKPGLRVCAKCNDQPDPWRLPPLRPENISLRFPRPDESVATGDASLITNPYGEVAITDEEGNPLVP